KSGQAGVAIDHLLALAQSSDEGLFWGDNQPQPVNQPAGQKPGQPQNGSAAIETTGYALLALTAHGDRLNGAKAARWLVSRRNAYGGWNSTQDTVVGLQSLAKFVAGGKSDVDATASFESGSWNKELRVASDNADVLQTIEAPLGSKVK